jgi:hypothetical protein
MKKRGLILGAVLFWSAAALAEPARYQVTAPIVEVRDDTVVLQKGNEKWEIAREKATSVVGNLKVGATVTVYYTMQASKIEVKKAPPAPAAPKKK